MEQKNEKKGAIQKLFGFFANRIWFFSEGAVISSKMAQLKKMEKEADFLYLGHSKGQSKAERYVMLYDTHFREFGSHEGAAAFAYANVYCDMELEKTKDCSQTLCRMLGNEKVCGDAKDRPYEHLMKRTDGGKISNEYKVQSLLLAAYLHDSSSPYRYDIILSNREEE